MNYINNIYKDYNIPDPMLSSTPRNINSSRVHDKRPRRKSIKAVTLKDNFRNQLSLSTKIDSFKVSPFKEL